MTDDAELLRRYAENCDEEAFAELTQRHLSLVYYAALRQCGGDSHRAEDVTQAVFTDLARKAKKLSLRPVLAGWLYTSTRYAAAQAVRGEARRQAREQIAHTKHVGFLSVRLFWRHISFGLSTVRRHPWSREYPIAAGLQKNEQSFVHDGISL